MENCDGCARGCSSGCDEKMSWRQFLLCFVASIVVASIIVFTGSGIDASAASDKKSCLTREEVEKATENMGKCLTIFGDKVYDYTKAKKWDLTGHVGQHLCGKEYDKETIEQGPHKLAVIDKFYYAPICGTQESVVVSNNQSIGIFGMTWFRFSAYASLVFFVLNFATCFAMPWAKLPEPWKGSRPGKDKNDFIGRFPLSHMHKLWAWLAIFTLGVHGILGFLGVLFGRWY